MKIIKFIITAACVALLYRASAQEATADYRESLSKTKNAIGEAFARGDVQAIVALHHPDVVKYFGGSNVVTGRAGLTKQLTDAFKGSKLEFVENKIESTVFSGETVVETCIFGIRATPKGGGAPGYFRGRSMVVYVRYKDSPYGWVSLREMTQAAPEDK
jgi:ketosteroid isomerase-like protein